MKIQKKKILGGGGGDGRVGGGVSVDVNREVSFLKIQFLKKGRCEQRSEVF